MDSRHDNTLSEPVSPELVLVDPELAERARRALREPVATFAGEPGRAWEPTDGEVGWRPREDVKPPSPQAWVVQARASAVNLVAESLEEQPSRSRWRRLSAALAAALAFVVVGALALPSNDDGRTSVADLARPQTTAPRSAVAGVEARKPDRLATVGEPASAQPRKARRRLTARTFIWVAVDKATHYAVTFRRGSIKVYEAWPTGPRLVIPRNARYNGRPVRFTSGTYRWRVRPAFGPRSHPRYGPSIVESTWVIR